jgi:Xaa-Pro aminopeptidase
VNADRLTVSQFQRLKDQVNEDVLVAGDDIVAELRQVKDDGEIDAIRRAQALTDKTFAFILEKLKPGLSEQEVAWEMEVYMRKNGAEGLAFPVMVGSGPNSALPHHDTGSRALQDGEYVLFDFGAKIDGYCADMTRTVFLGSPSDKHREVYDVVRSAQQACLDHLKANIEGKGADQVTRDVITEAGYGDHFGHGTGHGVGLEVHESPGMGPLRDSMLVEKAVVTVEPGVYIEGWGGVRIEDIVVLEADGITNLTGTPKDFLCL